MKIGIINYGMGNLASVKNALDFLSLDAEIFDNPDHIGEYEKLILPGVGAFGQAINNLRSSGFEQAIRSSVLEKRVPILGICLGMQLLLSESVEHGKHTGLNLVAGGVYNFNDIVSDLPVPHMGWNNVQLKNSGLAISTPDDPAPSYYFVHSFYCKLQEQQYATGIAEYGIPFHAMFEKGHIAGCQFHPEKSQKNGLTIFANFAAKNYG